MYATLAHNPSATTEQIFADIVAVATGETDINNLVSVSLVSSSIDATTPAGWTLHDDVSATEKIITAAVTDDPTRSKFIRIYVNASDIQCEVYKSWDAVAHTGVVYNHYNYAGSSNGVVKSIATTDANFGTVTCLSVSAAHFASSHLYTNEQSSYYPVIITEHNRESPWDTVANGYIPLAICRGDGSTNLDWTSIADGWNFPEGPVDASTDWDNSTGFDQRCVGGLNTIGMRSETTSLESCVRIPARTLNSSKQSIIPLQPMRVTGYNGYHLGGNITSKCNIYLTGAINAGWNSKIISGPDEYRVWPILNGAESSADLLYLAVKI